MTVLERLYLSSGAHSHPAEGMCAVEAAGYLAGEPWGDHPQCVDPGIAQFVRTVNDAMSDSERQRLVPYVPRLIGTNDLERRDTRIWLACDRVLRGFAPVTLRALGHVYEATLFEELAPITDMVGADDAARAVGYLTRNSTYCYARVPELSLIAYESHDHWATECYFDAVAEATVHASITLRSWDWALNLLDDLIYI